MKIYIVAEVYGGVLNEVHTFISKEKALLFMESLAKDLGFEKECETHWSNEDDDLTLWENEI